MSRSLINGFGPTQASMDAYVLSPPAGYSIVTTPTPPYGTYWMQVDSAAPGDDFTIGHDPGGNVPSKTYHGFVIRGFRCETALAAGNSFGIAQSITTTNLAIYLYGEGQASGNYKVELRRGVAADTLLATSETEYAINTTVTFRLQMDGVFCKVWINGILEIIAATTQKIALGITGWAIYCLAFQDIQIKRKWCQMAKYAWDADTDRPGVNVAVDSVVLDADTAGEDDLGDHVLCNSTNGTYAHWDDWASGANDGDTTYNCGNNPGGAGDLNTLSGKSTDITPTGTPDGVVCRYRTRANVGSKTVTWRSRIKSGANALNTTMPNMASSLYVHWSCVHPTTPGGGSWTDEITSLKAGIAIKKDNTAITFATAFAYDVVAVNEDPPRSLISRRQHVSALLGR